MFPFHTDKQDRPWIAVLAVVALAEAVALFVVSWRLAGGHFMFPLDDAYIHLQYARRIADGSPLVYTPGALPSGGMTSPLWALLLAPPFLVGLGGAKAAFLAYAAGAALWALLAVWVHQLATRLANPLCGMVASAVLLAHGHLLWNFLSGMETGLFAVLLTGAVLGAVVWWQDERPSGRAMLLVCLGLLPLARPEGAVALLAALAVVLARRGEQPRLSVVALLAMTLPMAAWLGILRFSTGDWRPAGLAVKGLGSFPWFTGPERLGFASDTLFAIVTKFHANVVPDPAYAAFKGMDRMPYMAPGLGLLALLGAALGLTGEGRTGRPAGASLLALTWLLGLTSLSVSLLPFIHQQRYLAPWTVLAIVLAAIALRRIGQLFQQLEDTVVRGLGLALVLVALPSVPWWMTEHGRNARDIYHLLRVATFSLSAEPSRHIAITDAGVLSFYTNHRCTDLVGLCSPEFTRATLHGEAATLEALSRLPADGRPSELVGYRNWFSDTFPLGSGTTLAAIPRTSITSGLEVKRMPIRWELIEAGMRPMAGERERAVWELDVASLPSEEASRYRFAVGPWAADPRAWPQPLAPVYEFRVGEVQVPLPRRADEPTTAPIRTVARPVTGVDGGRVVTREEFDFAPPGGFPGSALALHVRAAIPMHTGAPMPAARSVRLSVRSNTTGAVAAREVPLLSPEAAQARGYATLDLRDLLDEAGGTAWRVTVEALPEGAHFASFGYAATEPARKDRGNAERGSAQPAGGEPAAGNSLTQ